MATNMKSEIDLDRGSTLMHLANTYGKLPQTVQEMVQNGIDAEADRVLVCIDLKRHEVLVYDNGNGTDRTMFEQALANVGRSIKRTRSGGQLDKNAVKLGKFGLGLISPLSKCSSFTFSSSPRGQRKAIRWTFKVADIAKQDKTMEIPCEVLPALPGLPKRFAEYATDEFGCEYNTAVHMRGVTQDKVISMIDLDELADTISAKFAVPMRQRKAIVRLVLVDVNDRHTVRDASPLEYNGEPLGVVAYETEETGRVEFELYRSRRIGGQRQGKVTVATDNDTSMLTMQQFLLQIRGRGLGDVVSDAMKVLGSGYFEGVIRCEKIELAASRKSFVYGDALEMLYLVIDQWYSEYGSSHYTQEQDQTRHVRWQETGLKVLATIHDRLHSPEYAALWQNLLTVVEMGRLGGGHLDPVMGTPDGDDDERSLRVGQGGAGQSKGKPSQPGPSGPRQREPKDRPGDTPLTASGPSGNRRRLVKGDSRGLQLAHAEFSGDSRLWGFDFQDGTLTINTLHPIWVKLDETNGRHLAKNTKWIVHLQVWLIIEVLHLLLHYPDPEEFELRRDIIDDKVRNYVDLFIISSPR